MASKSKIFKRMIEDVAGDICNGAKVAVKYTYFFPSFMEGGYFGFRYDGLPTIWHTGWVSAAHLIPYLDKVISSNKEGIFVNDTDSNLYLLSLIPILTNIGNMIYEEYQNIKCFEECKEKEINIEYNKPSELEKKIESIEPEITTSKVETDIINPWDVEIPKI